MTKTRSRPAPASPLLNDRSVRLAPPSRRVRLPELAVGVLIVIAFSLGAVLWHLSSVSKSPALTVNHRVARGQAISSADLSVTYVASDSPLTTMGPDQGDRLVGRIALVDLEPGGWLAPTMVSDVVTVGDDDAVVGLALEPGEYPATALAVGDQVAVVRSSESPQPDTLILAESSTVYAVEDLASDRKLVSILAPRDEAESVAAASSGGSLRLILVSA